VSGGGWWSAAEQARSTQCSHCGLAAHAIGQGEWQQQLALGETCRGQAIPAQVSRRWTVHSDVPSQPKGCLPMKWRTNDI
jgi:hypothetical protein